MRPRRHVFTLFLAILLFVPASPAWADAARDACGRGDEVARTHELALDAWTEDCTGAQAWSPILSCGGVDADKAQTHATLLSGYGCRSGVVLEREAPGLP